MRINILLTLFFCSLFITACTTVSSNSNQLDDANKKQNAADANIQLGIAYLEEGNIALAKQKLLMALSLTPQDPAVWYAMGYYLEATGDNAKANEYYLHAIRLAPASGEVQNNYGTFLCHTGKPKESIQHFLIAVQDSDYIDIASAYENAGLCALLIPDITLAKKYFTLALARDLNRTRSLMELAAIEYQQKNYVQADDDLQKLFSMTKPTPATLLLAVHVQQKLNNPQAAKIYMHQLQQQFPNSPEARLVKGI